ncbi:ATP-binding cassette domain-containing protein [Paenibacillus tritici]|uniref:ATP-binding cassette domain-containing protein n=1 Tax=Paenibacillus tritici TaxID=1873425 RepID=A0ABX2DJ63_9BACL|nr:ATP-binding cassette domain-containing protein [Paenibacillus tritici]NQX44617.1 ATP-binding cassette domain-containing protein [Paenibacillus tritici]QUL53681.1 ATP-binding cassette domain-containing protein [Paenibacillus tritici]
MTDCMIEICGLTKMYKSKTAVRNADLKIYRGEIVGIIGRNGAGKSTLLKMIGGLVYPTSGELHFFNRAAAGEQSFFERMGVLIENPGLYPNVSAYENLNLLAMAYGLGDRNAAIEKLLQLVGLDSKNTAKVKSYSMGMRQRLGIAVALLGSPDVLILDEPINGLDPQGIVEIRQLILELNTAGLTILISSHILEELSKIATKYVIIHQGEFIEVLSREELQQRCEERIELGVEEARAALPVLERELNITKYKVVDSRTVYVYDENIHIRQIVKVLSEQGIMIDSIAKHKQSLEQYFLERTESAGERHD